jgi:hypothetical protein
MKTSKKNYTPFIIVFVIILVIALIFFFATKKKEKFDLCESESCIPSGFIGGYAESLPGVIGNKDISNEPMLDNRHNHDKITRQVWARFPEFSWQIGGNGTRIFQALASDVSRIGYDDTGKAYNLICPQFGSQTVIGPLNIEFTVASVRGYVNENMLPTENHCVGDCDYTGAVKGNDVVWTEFDIQVIVKIWFSRDLMENTSAVIDGLFSAGAVVGWVAPVSKATAILIPLIDAQTRSPYLRIRHGQNPHFVNPVNRQHPEVAGVCYLEAIPMSPYPDPLGRRKVDVLNQTIVDIVNGSSNDMFLKNNLLTWNLWAGYPTSVDQKEWDEHATKWAQSVVTPDGTEHTNGIQTLADGSPAPEPSQSLTDVSVDLAELTLALASPDFMFNAIYNIVN